MDLKITIAAGLGISAQSLKQWKKKLAALYVFVVPLVSTICPTTEAVGSPTQPFQMKLLPQTVIPFVGQMSWINGGLVSATA